MTHELSVHEIRERIWHPVIDILANITGGMHAHAPWGPVRDWTTDSWDAIVQLNLRYVFWTCRAVIPLMEARGGGISANFPYAGIGSRQ
jgi:NAD(P)-dependent dehydrogenase (short-subunit alcohol dehydrogenase family)